jgi:predicted Zn-dependent protease
MSIDTRNGGGTEIAARVLDLVRASRPDAEAEVTVQRSDAALTRFANSFIHQNVAESSATVRLRLHLDGRTSAGSTTVTGADGLRGLVERTVAAVGLCPPDPQWPGLATPAPQVPGPPVDEETAYAEPGARADRVAAFVAAAGGLETAGYVRTTLLDLAFANSAGQAVAGRSAEAAIDAIARVGTCDGVTRLAASRLADLDGALLGARAAAKARAGTDPIELQPGRYEVVLEPTAVLDVLQRIALYGFNAKAVRERSSFVELGRQQFDPAISLVDDPTVSGGLGLGFDIEGTPRHRLALVEAGVSRALVHDRRTAALAGTSSTGHALAGGAAFGAAPLNLIMEPDGHGVPSGSPPGETDGPAADEAVAALVSQVERGLLVTDHWYTRVLDPRSLVVTGLTRNGVWLIEDGRVTKPVQNLRFTQSYPESLAPGAVLGVGSYSVALPSGWDEMTYRAPALRLASWNHTGNASG